MGDAHGAPQAALSEIRALRDVKAAEARARELKTRAEADAKARAEATVVEARRIVERAEEEGRTTYDDALEQARHEAEVRAREVVGKGRSAADAARARAKGPPSAKAVERVLAEFKRRAGGS